MQMRVAAAAILGAVVAAALSAGAFQWLWSTSRDTAGAQGFLAEAGTILVTLAGAILGGLGAAWATMPRRAFFAFLGLFILVAAGYGLVNGSRMTLSSLECAFALGSLLVGRVLGWLVGVRGRNRSTATTVE